MPSYKPNPAYAGRTPEPLTPACHDQSPMLDVQCDYCGDISHLHETQLDSLPGDLNLGVRCAKCKHAIIFRVEEIQEGFAEMRRQGWIA